jgi:glycosyltransferase involved in cell wall biosynthesis
MKRNVLHFIYGFLEGGSEHQMLQLARHMRAAGRYEVGIACLNRHGKLVGEAEAVNGGEVPEFPVSSFRDRNALAQLRRFARFLREREITVVHTHDFYSNVFGMAGAALARVPARVGSKRETEGFRTPSQKRLERAAYRLAHAVIVNAEAVRAQLDREGVPAAKLVTVYNGLDMRRVEPPAGFRREEALRALGLPEGRRFVTIVANTHNPVKDHPTFLRAARRVKERAPEAAFVVAGEGQLLEDLRAYASELGIGGDTFFVGRCQRVAELLALSEVCVLSSKAEGFSNSILEYMAAGRPVVATDVGGAREAIEEGETGFVVPPGDDGGLGERVALLLADPERARRMGERGRRVVAERFSCEAQLANVESLYESLLARRV